jgi:hypothetical protein
MDEERRIELEAAITVGRRTLVPLAWTLGRSSVHGNRLNMVMCREAFGVIVYDGSASRVLFADGSESSLEELVRRYPSLADAVATLR